MSTSVSAVEQLVEDLSGNLDDLEASLAPLLNQAFAATTSQLPLLDKAKIYVLTTYAIESLLFSYLRLNGVDAKQHAVFRELTRVKAYFEKIKLAESGPAKRPTSLDKDAAARFVKHGLAGNDRYDRQRATQQEMNQTSQWGSANRFGGAAKRMREQEETYVQVVKAADVDDSDNTESKTTTDGDSKAQKKAAKRQKRQQAAIDPHNLAQHEVGGTTPTKKAKKKKHNQKDPGE